MLLSWLVNSIFWLLRRSTDKDKANPIEPTSSKEISTAALRTIIRQSTDSADLFFSDKTYLLCDINDIRLFLAQDHTNRLEYKAENFDCDDFAYRLMGQFSVPKWSALAMGICWTNLHALICFVDENNNLWFIEPQTDKVQSKLEPWQGNQIRVIMM